MIIKNESLLEFLQIILNKPFDKITETEIEQVELVRISTMNGQGVHSEKLDDLEKLSKLNKVIVFNSLICEDEISILRKINVFIEFEHCAFENDMILSKLNNIDSLIFNNCLIRDYNFLNNLDLKELQVINSYDETVLDLMQLIRMTRLKKLSLERLNVTGFNSFGISNLEELSLLNTLIDDFSFINRCPKLLLMFLSEKYLDEPIIQNSKERISFQTNLMKYAFEEIESESKPKKNR